MDIKDIPNIAVLKQQEIERFWDRQWEVLEKRIDGVGFKDCWRLQQNIFLTFFAITIKCDSEEDDISIEEKDSYEFKVENDDNVAVKDQPSEPDEDYLKESLEQIRQIEAEIKRLTEEDNSDTCEETINYTEEKNDDKNCPELKAKDEIECLIENDEVKDESYADMIEEEINSFMMKEDIDSNFFKKELQTKEKNEDTLNYSDFVSEVATHIKEELDQKPDNPSAESVKEEEKRLKLKENKIFSPTNIWHSKEQSCDFCGFRAANFWTLKTHIEMIHLHVRYHCTICKYNTKEKYILRGHIKKVHKVDISEDKMNYECGVCNIKTSLSGYNEHIRKSHTNLLKFTMVKSRLSQKKNDNAKCNFCDYTSEKRPILRNHEKNAHFKTNFECGICSYKNLAKRNVTKHIEINHIPRSFILDDKLTLDGKKMMKTFLVTKCSLCNEALNGYEVILNHMSTNHKNTIINSHVYKCKPCEETFTSRKELSLHKETLHDKKRNTPLLPCGQCKNVSKSRGNLKIHIMMKHMESQFRCTICKMIFRRSHELKNHIKTVHDSLGNEDICELMKCICMKCKFSSGFREFRKHAEEIHGAPKSFFYKSDVDRSKERKKIRSKRFSDCWNCNFCQVSSTQKSLVQSHMDLFHIRVRYLCKICESTSKHRFEIMKHFKSQHTEMDPESIEKYLLYCCAECDFNAGKRLFTIHIDEHAQNLRGENKEREGRYFEIQPTKQIKTLKSFQLPIDNKKCNFCGFHAGEKLKYHVIRTHGMSTFSCSICDFTSERKKPVNEHMSEHVGSKAKLLFKCGFCEFKSFEQKLAIHLEENHREHLKNDPKDVLQCNLCEFTHIEERKLTEHKGTVHNKWQCGKCGEVVPKRRNLEQHARNKHQLKTFDCQKCDFKSKHMSALQRHNECMHSEVKLFNCTNCGHEFSRKDNLLAHGRKVHSWK